MTRTINSSGETEAARGNPRRDPDQRSLSKAIRTAFHVYRYRSLEQNLRNHGWRKARRLVLKEGALSGEWIGRGGGEVRLTRCGLDVRLSGGEIRTVDWQQLWERARTSR